MKKITAILLVCAIFLSLFAACPTAAVAAGPNVSVIIVFDSPVTPEDVKYIEGMGGVIKYTYTIIDGIAASLPSAALARLRSLADNPGSDPVAGRIKYIENDSVMHIMDGSSTPKGPEPVTVQALPVAESASVSIADAVVPESKTDTPGSIVQDTLARLVSRGLHVFPVLPLASIDSVP